ncbi:hypothetical protein LTS18_009694, partial [Coniosporium uncinatum]
MGLFNGRRGSKGNIDLQVDDAQQSPQAETSESSFKVFARPPAQPDTPKRSEDPKAKGNWTANLANIPGLKGKKQKQPSFVAPAFDGITSKQSSSHSGGTVIPVNRDSNNSSFVDSAKHGAGSLSSARASSHSASTNPSSEEMNAPQYMMTKAVTNKDGPVLPPNAQYSRLTNPSPPPRVSSSMTDLSKPPAARTAGPPQNNYQANRRGRPYTPRSETTPGIFVPHLPDIDFGGHDLGDNLFVSSPKRRNSPPKQAPVGAAGRS